MPKIYDISLQLEILRKNKKKLHNDFPNLFSKEENETFLNNENDLQQQRHILLNYISKQKCDKENKKFLTEPLFSIIKK
jgi:hypothetical protein